MKAIYSPKPLEMLYQQQLDELDFAYESMLVETSFGDTHLLLAGKKGAQPIVLLHDANSCAPFILKAMKPSLTHFCVYAIDITGQANRSTAYDLPAEGIAYGQWMFEILSCLNLWGIHLMGVGLGGFICLKTLMMDEKRIAGVYLVNPGGLVRPAAFYSFWKKWLPTQLFRMTRNRLFFERYWEVISSSLDPVYSSFLSSALLHPCHFDRRLPLISQTETSSITTPIHLFLSENAGFFSIKKMQKQAPKLFLNLSKVVLLKNEKQLLSAKACETITQYIEHLTV